MPVTIAKHDKEQREFAGELWPLEFPKNCFGLRAASALQFNYPVLRVPGHGALCGANEPFLARTALKRKTRAPHYATHATRAADRREQHGASTSPFSTLTTTLGKTARCDFR